MARSQQKEWLADVLESVPSVVFLALWQGQAGLRVAGWAGAFLAAAVLVGSRRFRLQYNPILLGVNIHLLLATPLIEATFHLGAQDLGRTLSGHGHRGVLVTVFVVGCVLTLRSARGFVGLDGLPAASRLAYSAALLAVSAGTIFWSFLFATGRGSLLAIAVPLMVLVALRRFLVAHWRDRSKQVDGIAAAGASSAFAAASPSDPA